MKPASGRSVQAAARSLHDEQPGLELQIRGLGLLPIWEAEGTWDMLVTGLHAGAQLTYTYICV